MTTPCFSSFTRKIWWPGECPGIGIIFNVPSPKISCPPSIVWYVSVWSQSALKYPFPSLSGVCAHANSFFETRNVDSGKNWFPPAWSKWRCEFTTYLILSGARSIFSNCVRIPSFSSPTGAKAFARPPHREAASLKTSGWGPVSKRTFPSGWVIRKTGIGISTYRSFSASGKNIAWRHRTRPQIMAYNLISFHSLLFF